MSKYIEHIDQLISELKSEISALEKAKAVIRKIDGNEAAKTMVPTKRAGLKYEIMEIISKEAPIHSRDIITATGLPKKDNRVYATLSDLVKKGVIVRDSVTSFYTMAKPL